MFSTFKIIALAYFIVAGQPVGEAVPVPHAKEFVGLDSFKECQEYLKSDKLAMERARLSAALGRALQDKVEEQAKANEEAVPSTDVAITVSCEKDDSL